MPATALDRRAFLALLAAAPSRERPIDVVAKLASALSAGRSAEFMRLIDPGMPAYDELQSNIRALLAAETPASSIDPLDESGDDRRRVLRLNWVLEVSGNRREQVVTCEVEARGSRWMVIRLEPVSFFAPRR